MTEWFHAVRVPSFGAFRIAGAGYYGYAFAVHVGPWLIFCFPVEDTP